MAIQTNAQEMNKVPTVKLNNGMEMPQLGVGTYAVTDDVTDRVCHAIKTGVRLIDTAQGYGNEKGVGEGIHKSGIDRRELFVTTKVNTTEMRNGTVRESLDKSIADLGTDCAGTCKEVSSPSRVATTITTLTRISISSTSSLPPPKWRLSQD